MMKYLYIRAGYHWESKRSTVETVAAEGPLVTVTARTLITYIIDIVMENMTCGGRGGLVILIP